MRMFATAERLFGRSRNPDGDTVQPAMIMPFKAEKFRLAGDGASDAERAGVREEFVGAAGGSTPGVRMIVGRVARLSRDPDGKLVFAIERGVRESDGAEGPGGVDRLAVLPCRLYPALEGLWASRGDGAWPR